MIASVETTFGDGEGNREEKSGWREGGLEIRRMDNSPIKSNLTGKYKLRDDTFCGWLTRGCGGS